MKTDKLHSLLKPGERLDLTDFPWERPKKGDMIRATCLFDLDPQETQDENCIVSLVSDCRVSNVEDSVNPGLTRLYYDDTSGADIPEPERRYSEYELEILKTWGGVSYWGQSWCVDWIPLHAIKETLTAGLAARLKRQHEYTVMGIM